MHSEIGSCDKECPQIRRRKKKEQKKETGREVLAVGGKGCIGSSKQTSCNVKQLFCPLWIVYILLSAEFLWCKLRTFSPPKVWLHRSSYTSWSLNCCQKYFSSRASHNPPATANHTIIYKENIFWKSLKKTSSNHEWVMISQPFWHREKKSHAWSFGRHFSSLMKNMFPHSQSYNTCLTNNNTTNTSICKSKNWPFAKPRPLRSCTAHLQYRSWWSM